MREGKVRVVDIVGKVDGIYLEPRPPGWDTLPDSNGTRRGTPAATPPGGTPPASPRPAPDRAARTDASAGRRD